MHRALGAWRSTPAWERLINLRCLVLPIAPYMPFYIKTISQLRRQSKFQIIDQYFRPHWDSRLDHVGVIERCKLEWDTGRPHNCLLFARLLVSLLDVALTPETFRSVLCNPSNDLAIHLLNPLLGDPNLPGEIRQFWYESFGVTNDNDYLRAVRFRSIQEKHVFVDQLFDQFLPALYQLQLSYQKVLPLHHKNRVYRLFGMAAYRLAPETRDLFIISAKAYLTAARLEPSDSRSWRGWGYANARLFMLAQPSPRRIRKPDEAYATDSDSPWPETVMQSFQREEDVVSPDDQIEDVNPFFADPDPDLSIHRPVTLEPVTATYEKSGNEYGIACNDPSLPADEPGVEIDMTDADLYALNAIWGFFKAAELAPADGLEFMSELFSVLFAMTNIDVIPPSIFDAIVSLPPTEIALTIPQLISQIAHPLLHDFVSRLVKSLSANHFEQIYYALKVCLTSDIAPKQHKASELLDGFQMERPTVAEDAALLWDGMARASITWFESWAHVLKQISRLDAKGNFERAFAVFDKHAREHSTPVCELDQLFVRSCGVIVSECMVASRAQDRDRFIRAASQLYAIVTERVSKLSVLVLPKISEKLAGKRDFTISIPGKFKNQKLLKVVESVLEIMGTRQRPRIVFMSSNTGTRYKYLLKGLEDLRNDERLMQFFSLVNAIFRGNTETRDHNMYIVRYAIVPLSINAGLIAWVDGVDTFQQMVFDYRKSEDLVELSILAEHIDSEFSNLTAIQKYEMFQEVAERCNAEDLFRLRWIRSANAEQWLKLTQRFTVTTAVMSMIGYVIGLGDRHPSNIMVQRATGNVVHIDFCESFEATLTRKHFRERVQFRLTRMIEKALESSTVVGFFTRVAETVLSVMRNNRWSLSALIAIFVSEPLEVQDHAIDLHEAVKKVSQKMEGKFDGKVVPVREQVAALIDEARNPMNYVQHYPGWCPFW
jgi:hypothetical protein